MSSLKCNISTLAAKVRDNSREMCISKIADNKRKNVINNLHRLPTVIDTRARHRLKNGAQVVTPELEPQQKVIRLLEVLDYGRLRSPYCVKHSS